MSEGCTRRSSTCVFGRLVDDFSSMGQDQMDPKAKRETYIVICGLGVILTLNVLIGANVIQLTHNNSEDLRSRTVNQNKQENETIKNFVDLKNQIEKCSTLNNYPDFQEDVKIGPRSKPPWHVSVWSMDRLVNNTFKFTCAATFIGDGWALTTAHCFISGKKFMEKFRINGSNHIPYRSSIKRYISLTSILSKIPEDLVEIEEPFYVHPDYQPERYKNDLILFRIPEKVKPKFSPLCFPTSPFKTGTTCWISGTAITSIKTDDLVIGSDWIYLINYPDCKKTLDKAIQVGDLCAVRENVDACQGDSGGALACWSDENQVWEGAGIISAMLETCGNVVFPGIYTDIFYASEWIKTIIQQFG